METPCAVGTGAWRQLENAVELEPATSTARACGAALAAPSRSVAQALSGRLHYAVGANGDLVLTDGEHWAIGWRDVTFDRDQPHLLSGEWRVVSADGAAPPRSERPAELFFGPGAYGVWDGCQHSEGVAIVYERQLFTHGSGMVTLANCPDDPIRRKINAVVASRPRIGRGAEGALALISPAGTLRLERRSQRAFATAFATRPVAGTFNLMTGSTGSARLTIGPGSAFTVALPCGSFGGRWRSVRASGIDRARFGPERPPAGCGDDPLARRLYNFFTGDVRVASSPNRDIALFVSRGDSLPARFADEPR